MVLYDVLRKITSVPQRIQDRLTTHRMRRVAGPAYFTQFMKTDHYGKSVLPWRCVTVIAQEDTFWTCNTVDSAAKPFVIGFETLADASKVFQECEAADIVGDNEFPMLRIRRAPNGTDHDLKVLSSPTCREFQGDFDVNLFYCETDRGFDMCVGDEEYRFIPGILARSMTTTDRFKYALDNK